MTRDRSSDPWEEAVRAVAATPRPAGTPDAAAARERLTGHLERLGFTVEEIPFAFAPASARALPILGAGIGWLTLLQIPLLTVPTVPRWVALVAWGAGLAGLCAVVRGVALGWTALGAEPARDASLLAARGGTPVRRWLLVHLDTAAHGPSWAGRLAALALVAAAAAGFLALGGLRLAGAVSLPAVAAVAGIALMGSALAARGRRAIRCPGGRDSGTGLTAVLAAISAAPPEVGVVVTGAHEYGRVGARILSRFHGQRFAGAEVIELEVLDGAGPVHLVPSGPEGRDLARTIQARLEQAGVRARVTRLPIRRFDAAELTDAAGRVTVFRAEWRTLSRLHTERDGLEGVDLRAAARIGQAIV